MSNDKKRGTDVEAAVETSQDGHQNGSCGEGCCCKTEAPQKAPEVDLEVSLEKFTHDTILAFSSSIVDFETQWRKAHIKNPTTHPIQLKRSEWSTRYREFMKGSRDE